MNAYYNLTNHTTLPADETLYTIWIGTNDIGAGQLCVARLHSLPVPRSSEWQPHWPVDAGRVDRERVAMRGGRRAHAIRTRRAQVPLPEHAPAGRGADVRGERVPGPVLDGRAQHDRVEHCAHAHAVARLAVLTRAQFMKELVAAGNELTRLYIANLAPKLPGATIGMRRAVCTAPSS
jgi:hypothetical protein